MANPHMDHLCTTLLIVCCMLMLAGCGTPPTPALTAAAVYQPYLDALQHNDRATFLTVSVDDPHAASDADHYLERITWDADSANVRTGAHLARVELVALVDEGAGTRGTSRWVYANRTMCHDAILAETPAGWPVTAWYELPHCPAS